MWCITFRSFISFESAKAVRCAMALAFEQFGPSSSLALKTIAIWNQFTALIRRPAAAGNRFEPKVLQSFSLAFFWLEWPKISSLFKARILYLAAFGAFVSNLASLLGCRKQAERATNAHDRVNPVNTKFALHGAFPAMSEDRRALFVAVSRTEFTRESRSMFRWVPN